MRRDVVGGFTHGSTAHSLGSGAYCALNCVAMVIAVVVAVGVTVVIDVFIAGTAMTGVVESAA